MSEKSLIHLEGVTKVFTTEDVETHALSGIHLEIRKGEYVTIAGPSGCGKSTLLAILGLLDSPSGGSYTLNDQPVQGLKLGDLKAAEKYLREYYKLGGVEKGLEQSTKRAHPLGGLAQKEWRTFLATLSPQERESFNIALKWYNKTYLSSPSGQVKALARRPEGFEPSTQGNETGKLTIQEALKMMK